MSDDLLRRIPPRINVGHFMTLRGAIECTEIVLGLIVASCANVELCEAYEDGDGHCGSASEFGASGQGFVVFVAVAGLIFTALLVFAYLLELQDRIYNLPWASAEMAGLCVVSVLYFVAMAVVSWDANGFLVGIKSVENFGVRGAWIAAAVFSAFNWLLYSAHVAMLWWRTS